MGGAGTEQVDVKPGDTTDIEYLYDFSSIFATPEQERLFGLPFQSGAQLDLLTRQILRALEEDK